MTPLDAAHPAASSQLTRAVTVGLLVGRTVGVALLARGPTKAAERQPLSPRWVGRQATDVLHE